MAIRGRKPKSKAQRELEGNPGRKPINENEPKVEPAEVEPPDTLGPDAKEEWDRILPLLFAARIMTKLDRALLTAYCEAWGGYLKACREVARVGDVIPSHVTCPACKAKDPECTRCKGRGWVAGNLYQSPHTNVRAMYYKQMTACAAELGMSPISRTRIHVTPDSASGKATGADQYFEPGLKVVG